MIGIQGLFFLLGICSVALSSQKMVYMIEKGEDKQIAISNMDGSDSRVLTKGARWHLYPSIDSSGEQVAYVEGAPVDGKMHLGVKVLNLRSGLKESWTQEKGMHLHPNFSGDGRYLAFAGPLGAGDKMQIGVLDLTEERKGENTNKAKPLIVESEYASYFPALASDGRFVIFQRTKGEYKDIVSYDFSSKKIDPLTEVDGQAMAPDLSFDDKAIVFTQKKDRNWDIYLLNLKTRERLRLTKNDSRDFAPSFRPDGSVVFASDRNGNFELFELSAEQIKKKEFVPKALLGGRANYYAPSVSGELEIKQAKLAPMRNPARSSFGAIRLGNRVYVVGGHQGPEHTYPPESFMGRVEFYDLKTRKWGKLQPRPVRCHGFGLAAHGKYLYAFGGFAYSDKHNPKWKSLDQIDRYDTELDQWETIGKLPRKRSSNVVAQLNGKVYLIGGWDSTPKFDKDYNGRFHGEIDVFDLKTEKITANVFQMPKPLRRALSATVVGDEIVLLGGLGVGSTHFELIDHVTAFRPATNRWRTLANLPKVALSTEALNRDWDELPKLPFATFAPAAGAIDGDIYLFGGMHKVGPMAYVYVNHTYVLKQGTQRWVHTGRYLSETKGFSQVVDLKNGVLGILGGHSYEGTDAPVGTFETYARKARN